MILLNQAGFLHGFPDPIQIVTICVLGIKNEPVMAGVCIELGISVCMQFSKRTYRYKSRMNE